MKPYLRMIAFLLLSSFSIILGSFACDYPIVVALCKLSWGLSIVAFLVTMVRNFWSDAPGRKTVP